MPDTILQIVKRIEGKVDTLLGNTVSDEQEIRNDTRRLRRSGKNLQAALDAQRRANPPVNEKTEGNT